MVVDLIWVAIQLLFHKWLKDLNPGQILKNVKFEKAKVWSLPFSGTDSLTSNTKDSNCLWVRRFIHWPLIVHVVVICCFAEIRTEAVMQALAAHSKKIPVMPLPSKRTSVNYHGQQRHRDSRQGLYSRALS